MTPPKLTASNAKPAKQAWPYPEITTMTCDLARNQWVKRIRGKLYSFGVLADPEAALKRYQADGPALHAGLERQIRSDGITVGEVIGLFLQSKSADVKTGKIQSKTYGDYEDTACRVAEFFGIKRTVASLRPIDFEKLLRSVPFGPTRGANFVVWTKMIFSWAHDAEVLDATPRFGKSFRGANSKERRRLRHRAGKNLLTPEQIKAILERASVPIKAMTLLAINGGLGNNDCAELTLSAITLDTPKDHTARHGFIDFPRPKTGVERQIPLWKETADAIQTYLAQRPKPINPDDADTLFINTFGRPYIHGNTDALGQEFHKLLLATGVVKKKPKLKKGEKRKTVLPIGFYTLRRTFRTVADQADDQHAVHRIMGHTIPGMSGVYVQEIKMDRLVKVVDHVRTWLFPIDKDT